MSEERKVESAQDLYDALNHEGSQMHAILAECERLRGAIGQIAVSRNGRIARLDSLPHAEVGEWVATILKSAALDDETTIEDVRFIEFVVEKRAARVDHLREQFAKIWRSLVDKNGKLEADATTHQRKLEELTNRLKEHALHNSDVRDAVWAITGGKCYYCDVELQRCPDEQIDRSRCFHIDHLVPKTAGGPDHLSNYVPACGRCNISKGAKSYVEFLAWRKAQQPSFVVIEGGAEAAG